MSEQPTIRLHRDRTDAIIHDLQKKMVFLVGPRQVGKTWLAREVGKSFAHTTYLTYDSPEDRDIMRKHAWLHKTDLLILDELHKMKGWKNYLKGLYDTKDPSLHILVTGSARLETFRRVGDSLAGRFFVHHLLPLSLHELATQSRAPSYATIDRLIERGGFPEPFLAEDAIDADRWRTLYADSLIRTDVVTFEVIHNIQALQQVFELLRRKIGSPISYANIARDLGISPITVKRYIEALEALYIVFIVRPYAHKITRAILKEPKVYFFDTGLVVGDDGARFENFVAVSLLKQLTTRNDTLGQTNRLAYVRTKNGQEVDFALVDDTNTLFKIVEAKCGDTSISKNLKYFTEKYDVAGEQVVKVLSQDREEGRIQVRDATRYFTELE